MRIFMYDNDRDNFRGMEPEVECVYVDSTTPNPLVTDPGDPYGYYEGFARKYPRNAYIRFIRSRGEPPELCLQEPQPGNGITEAMMDSLLRIAARDPATQKIVFFDWDGTLIVTEGMNPFSVDAVGRGVIEGQLAFLMGGPERLKRIRQFFRLLHRLSVDIYILTNNQMFLGNLKEVFYRYIDVLTPYIPRDNIYGSVRVVHTSRRSNKALYLSHREKIWKREKTIPASSFRVSGSILRDHLGALRSDEIMVQAFRERPAMSVQTVLDRDGTINDLKKKSGVRGVYYFEGRRMDGNERIRDVTKHASPVFVVKKK